MTPWRPARWHAVLLPDYRPRSAALWWAFVLVGALCLGVAGAQVVSLAPALWVRVAIGCGLAALAGFFPIRVPRTTTAFAAGETFIFLLLLLHGPAAATLAAAVEALVGSWRASRRWSSRIVSPAIAAMSMFACGHALQALLAPGASTAGALLLGGLLAGAYALCTSMLIALILVFKRNGPPAWRDWLASFADLGWVVAVHVAAAVLAAMLYGAWRDFGDAVLLAALGLSALLLTTLHFFFQRRVAMVEAREARLQAAEAAEAQARRHAAELESREQRFRGAFDDAAIGMALLESSGRIVQANAALERLLGLGPGQLLDRSLAEFVDDDSESTWMSSRFHGADGTPDQTLNGKLRLRRDDGTRLWVQSRCSPFSHRSDALPQLIVQMHDVTTQHRAEGQLRRMAYEDALTALPNRRWLLEELGRILAAPEPQARRHRAVLLFDLDRFKLVNDTLGHDRGDEYLRRLGERVGRALRPGDHVVRLGGDEFAVLLSELPSRAAARDAADRLLRAIGQPLMLAGERLLPASSVGIAMGSPLHGCPEDWLREADLAMYEAKTQGGSRGAVFDPQQQVAMSNRLRLESELREAVRARQVELAFQPLYRLDRGGIDAFEALARWTRKSGEIVSPEVFVGLAEQTGLMGELTDLVLGAATRRMRTWLDTHMACREVRMHVNVSSDDLSSGTLVARIERALQKAALPPRHLAIEVTESVAMRQLDDAVHVMRALRAMGVAVCIDDFGTGYSSLSWLSRLPVDCVKIDRSFVQGLSRGAEDAEVVRAIVALGKALHKRVVAEGIESVSQLDQLVELGCEVGQGHFFAAASAAALDTAQERLPQRRRRSAITSVSRTGS